MILNTSPHRGRFIVLIPACLTENMALARKVHWMANRDQREVLYLALVDDREEWLSVSRCMATMEAVTGANSLTVNSKITETSRWLSTLREIYRPGDTIVCQAEQIVRDGWFRTLPVSDLLRETLTTSVEAINGFYHPRQVQLTHWLAKLLFWFGFLAILAGFTALEIQLEQSVHGSVRMLLLALVMFFEFGLVWAWSRIASH